MPGSALLELNKVRPNSKDDTKLNLLFKKCTSGEIANPKSIINPSMVLLYTVSPFNLWCDLFAPQSEKDPEPESLKILAKIGNLEEDKYVQETYPQMQTIEVETREQGFFEVLKRCFEGATAFHSAPLIYLPEQMLGIPDILEKSIDHKSIFGKHHYVVKEKKTTIEPQKKHVLQAALNNYIIGKIQGYTPPTFLIVNRNNKEFTFSYELFADQLQNSIAGIRNILGGETVTPTKGALQDPWKSYGMRKAKEIGDISLVSGVGQQKKELLVRAGIRTISDMKNADIGLSKVKGVGMSSFVKWRTHAEAILEDRIIPMAFPPLRPYEIEIFLDLEGTYDLSNLFLQQLGITSSESWSNTTYLIGTLVVQKDKREYVPYFAATVDQEKAILLEFISSLRSKQNYVIYHYGTYEKTRINQMLEKYGIKDDFTSTMVDLSHVLKNSAMFPTYSFGLKDVAKRLGFSWSQQGMDGFLSIAHYLTYLETQDHDEVVKILKYNEEDCEATCLVKDFLDSLRQQTPLGKQMR